MCLNHLAVVAALVALGAPGAPPAAPQAPREWPTYAVAAAPESMRSAIEHGDVLIVTLHSALLSELRREFDAHGAVGALEACHLDSTAVGYYIERRDGTAVGRTAARLRNPTNAPKPWAAPIVAKYADARAADVDGFVVDLGDRIGLLRPIAELSTCAPCHGPASRLDAHVVAALPERYPRDKAIGFKDGDLRGWFWVEMPKQ